MRFRLGSIPVHVRVPFFILALVFASSEGNDPKSVGIVAAIIFLAVLVHELGHALVIRALGRSPQIELHGMGGTTSWETGGKDIGNARQIAVSLAGPFAGFFLYGVVVVMSRFAFDPAHPIAHLAMKWLRWVTIGWGIANLVPMLPLDGGNVMRSVLHAVTKGRGEKPARVISIGMAGLILMLAAATKNLWMGFLAALFTFSNMQALRQVDTRSADAPLAEAIDKAYLALERHDGAAAKALLEPVLSSNASPDLLAIGLRILAYSLLIEGEWKELMPLLERNWQLIGAEELARYAKTARELGKGEEAAHIEALVPRPRAANDFG